MWCSSYGGIHQHPLVPFPALESIKQSRVILVFLPSVQQEDISTKQAGKTFISCLYFWVHSWPFYSLCSSRDRQTCLWKPQHLHVWAQILLCMLIFLEGKVNKQKKSCFCRPLVVGVSSNTKELYSKFSLESTFNFSYFTSFAFEPYENV